MANTHVTGADGELDVLAAQVMDAISGAPQQVLEEMLREVSERDLYRETVEAMLRDEGVYCDPLGLCPNLAPEQV